MSSKHTETVHIMDEGNRDLGIPISFQFLTLYFCPV